LQKVNPRTSQAETHTFKVRIPAGVQEGQTIRVPGKGGEGSGRASAGDLYLRVRLWERLRSTSRFNPRQRT